MTDQGEQEQKWSRDLLAALILATLITLAYLAAAYLPR